MSRLGELDEAGHAALQKHIADCPFCREASRQFTDLFCSLDLLLANDRPK
jgi:predicted anti-sigma-YlaC factor YlaD